MAIAGSCDIIYADILEGNMKFEENLVKLRKSKGLSQEELAEKLNVSRQTVYKWETGQSYPELDRLMLIAKLFGRSIDDLVNKELEFGGDAEAKAKYERFYNRYSLFIALGVFLVVLAAAALLAALAYFGESGYFIPFAIYFVIFLAGNGLLVYFGIQSDYFRKTIPENIDFYSPEERRAFSKRYAFWVTAGLGIMFLGIAALFVGLQFLDDLYSVAIMLAFFAVGIFLLVYAGLLDDKYKMKHRGRVKRRNAKGRKISSVIMLSAVIVFLLLGFLLEKWHPGWVVFPIAGLGCAIADVIARKE